MDGGIAVARLFLLDTMVEQRLCLRRKLYRAIVLALSVGIFANAPIAIAELDIGVRVARV
jgi:hypothetical protein